MVRKVSAILQQKILRFSDTKQLVQTDKVARGIEFRSFGSKLYQISDFQIQIIKSHLG